MKPSMKYLAVAVAAAAVASGVGVAAAVTLQADTTIVGCVNRDTKLVRIVQRARNCRDTEDVVTWNQTGPAGPTGLTGAEGPTGPIGPVGPAGADGRTIGYFGMQPTSPAPAPLKPNQLTTIVTITDVAVGTYQGTVSTIVTTDGLPKGIDVNVYCRVIDETTKPSRTVNFFALPNRWSTVSAAVLFRVNTDGSTVRLRCQGDPATLVDTRLQFVKVTN